MKRRRSVAPLLPNTISGATATAIATVANGSVCNLILTSGGSGYISVPSVVFVGGEGFGARATAVVENGSVTSLTLLSGGRNYQATPPTVEILLNGGAALLNYGVLPDPNPLQVPQTPTQVSRLTLNVSNSSLIVIDVASIVVTLPGPGQDAQDLTNSFDGIGVQVPIDSNNNPLWNVSQSGGTFTLVPASDVAGEIAGAGLYFIFDNIVVNKSVGACSIQIAETSSSTTQPSGTRSVPDIQIQKWVPQFYIAGPIANPLQVSYNNSTEVQWSVTGAGVTCQLIYDPDGNGPQPFPVANVGSKFAQNLTNSRGVVFTLQVTVPVAGQSPLTTQQQVSVPVVPSPQISFTIQPNSVTPGRPVTFKLAWALVDVTSFQISANDGPNGNTYTLPVPISSVGTFIVTPHLPTVAYELQVLSSNTSRGKKENP